LLNALDDSTTAPAWVSSSVLDRESCNLSQNRVLPYNPTSSSAVDSGSTPTLGSRADKNLLLKVTRLVCEKIIVLEPQLTSYDSICGDGDCGMVMKRGAEHVISAFTDAYVSNTTVDLTAFFNRLADTLSASMGGTSGVLLELCFRAMALSFKDLYTQRAGAETGDDAAGAGDWTAALAAGVSI
jgi:dihydroxyacetone kinase